MSSKYIVVFKDHATPEQIQQYAEDLNSKGGVVGNRYDILKGFAATIPDNHFVDLNSLSLRQEDDLIDYIERDSVVTIQ